MENNSIHTVQDLIDYLQTLDSNKPIVAEYIKVFNNLYTGIEERPLLKSLFEDKGMFIQFKAMFY